MAEPVVIVSPPGDEQARAVRARLVDMGVDAMILDLGSFPDAMQISLGEDLLDIEIDGQWLLPRSVYLRDLRPGFAVAILQRWEAAGIRVYNSISALPRLARPYQLSLLAAAGLPVPATRWTNDPATVRAFAGERRLVFKPVAGDAATHVLDEAALRSEALERLRRAPICFQELLPGADIRVYVVDQQVVASEPFAIDHATREICIRAAAMLGLRYTGVDLKLDADGLPRILELDPCPMVLGFDAASGTDVLGALCSRLAAQ